MLYATEHPSKYRARSGSDEGPTDLTAIFLAPNEPPKLSPLKEGLAGSAPVT